MRLTCELLAQDAASRALALLDRWQAEHEEYYGTDHGATAVPLPWDLALLDPARSRLRETHDGRAYAGYADLPGDGGRWLSSAGNWAAVLLRPPRRLYQAGGPLLIVSSRRHGIPSGVREVFAGVAWEPVSRRWVAAQGDTYAAASLYETLCPEADPMACDLVPA